MKKYKVLFVLSIIMLSLLIIARGLIGQNEMKKYFKSSTPKENVAEVTNQGMSVVEYNGDIYYIKAQNEDDTFKNSLYKRNIKTKSEEKLYGFGQYEASKELLIYKNRVFFNVVGQTYSANVDDMTDNTSFNEGNLHYIKDGKAIYTYGGNAFLAKYYPKTFVIYDRSLLLRGSVEYLGIDENSIYFVNTNKDETKTVVSINLENYDAIVLDEIVSPNKKALNVLKCEISTSVIYLLIKDNNDNTFIRKVYKNQEEGKTIDFNGIIEDIVKSKNKLYFVTSDFKTYCVKADGTTVESDLNEQEINLFQYKIENEKMKVYRNAKELFEIGVGKNNVTKFEAYKIGSNVYVRFDEIESETGNSMPCLYEALDSRKEINKLF